jgi:hypothetical protein
MPKVLHVTNVNGVLKHIEQTTGNVFEGHVAKDLDIGDRFEMPDNEGIVRMKEVKEKYITDNGYTVIAVEEVIQ